MQRLFDLERWWNYATQEAVTSTEDARDALEHAAVLSALGRAADPAVLQRAIALASEAIRVLGIDDQPDARYLLSRCLMSAGRPLDARRELEWVLANSGDSLARWRSAKLLLSVTFADGPEQFSTGVAAQMRHLEELLATYGPDERDRVWALAQNNLAVGYIRLWDQSNDQGDLGPAVSRLRLALTFFDEAHHPFDWALASLNLAETLASLDGGSQQEAEQAARGAARVYQRDVFTEMWAKCQHALVQGALIDQSALGTDAVRRLIEQLDQALNGTPRDRYPVTHAEILRTEARCWLALADADPTALSNAERALVDVVGFADTQSPVRRKAAADLDSLRNREALPRP